MKLKYAYKGISKNFIYSILLIIQLIFSFTVIYENIGLSNNVSDDTKYVTKFFSDNKFYDLRQVDSADSSNMDEAKIDKVFNYLESSKNFKFIQYSPNAFKLKQFADCQQFSAYSDIISYPVNNMNFFDAKNLTVNENYLRIYPFKLKEGRIFTKQEFQRNYGDKNELPIIVGSNYGKYYKPGDEVYFLKDGGVIHKARIIGIIDNNQFLPGDISSTNLRYINTNNYIITTNAINGKSQYMFDFMFNGNYVLLDKDSTETKVDNTLNQIKKTFLTELNVKVGWNDDNKYTSTESTLFGMQQKTVMAMTLVIISFASITLIISSLNSVIKRKTEFGIHILNGGTLKDISITIYLEVFLILAISFILSLPAIYLIHKGFNALYLFEEFCIILILSIIISALPVIKISKLNVSDLIKGDD